MRKKHIKRRSPRRRGRELARIYVESDGTLAVHVLLEDPNDANRSDRLSFALSETVVRELGGEEAG